MGDIVSQFQSYRDLSTLLSHSPQALCNHFFIFIAEIDIELFATTNASLINSKANTPRRYKYLRRIVTGDPRV